MVDLVGIEPTTFPASGDTLCRACQPNLAADLVDLVGIEPTTSSMPWKRAPNCATGPQK